MVEEAYDFAPEIDNPIPIPYRNLGGLRRSLPLERQGELKDGPLGYVGRRPHASAMRLDDRTADRQSHAHTIRLGRVECVEEPVHALRLQARAGILYGDEDAGRTVLLVLITSFRDPSRDPLIASTALKIRLSITC